MVADDADHERCAPLLQPSPGNWLWSGPRDRALCQQLVDERRRHVDIEERVAQVGPPTLLFKGIMPVDG